MVLSSKEWLDKMDEIIAAIQNNGCDSQVIMDMLSNMWISSVTYNVGDYVLYNNNIWKCLVKNSNITPTEGSTWTSVKITNEISTLNSNLNDRTIQVYKYSSANPGNQGGNTYQYAPIRLNCLNANDGGRVGIGFENAGVNAGFLYLALDGNLYFMDHLGVDHKISMS